MSHVWFLRLSKTEHSPVNGPCDEHAVRPPFSCLLKMTSISWSFILGYTRPDWAEVKMMRQCSQVGGRWLPLQHGFFFSPMEPRTSQFYNLVTVITTFHRLPSKESTCHCTSFAELPPENIGLDIKLFFWFSTPLFCSKEPMSVLEMVQWRGGREPSLFFFSSFSFRSQQRLFRMFL